MPALGRVDAIEADTLPMDLDRVAIDDGGDTGNRRWSRLGQIQ
ncbi:hypothetical protein [Mesorhizobium japonicum]